MKNFLLLRKGIIIRALISGVLFPVAYTLLALSFSDFETGKSLQRGILGFIDPILLLLLMTISSVASVVFLVAFWRDENVPICRVATTVVLCLELVCLAAAFISFGAGAYYVGLR